MKPNAIVFDIDGVILDTRFIHKEIIKQKLEDEDKWNYFYEQCNSDRVTLIKGIKEFYQSIRDYSDAVIILCTARNEKCADATYHKLIKEGINDFEGIYMRAYNDKREDVEVKEDLINDIKSKYNIIAFIDDSLRNCEVAKKSGLLALRVV